MKKPVLLDLRPCQFVLGMKEVEFKIKKMKKLKGKELKDYCDDHVIPLVRGPEQELFIIDHHHFARACWELSVYDYSVHLLEDLSHLNEQDFWNRMVKNDWTYLHDQFGFGPHLPSALPMDIRCLADDPFRSLVWAVIDAGGIEKQAIPFFEFKWAAFFRMTLSVRLHSKSNFTSALKQAIELATSRNADHLPGFQGRKHAKMGRKGSSKKASRKEANKLEASGQKASEKKDKSRKHRPSTKKIKN